MLAATYLGNLTVVICLRQTGSTSLKYQRPMRVKIVFAQMRKAWMLIELAVVKMLLMKWSASGVHSAICISIAARRRGFIFDKSTTYSLSAILRTQQRHSPRHRFNLQSPLALHVVVRERLRRPHLPNSALYVGRMKLQE